MLELQYVLVTAARNEAEHIAKTLATVVSQTIRPQRWIIVSDGSTDDTDEIVARYSEIHPWITLLRVDNGPEHSFRKQARSQNTGFEALKKLPFDAIGFLDGDTSVPSDLYEFLLSRLQSDPLLGVVGCPYVVGDDDMGARPTYDQQHVHGACQLFRRKCFEEIGSFTEMETGGHDKIAIVQARMNGWRTQSFIEMRVTVHKAVGFGEKRRTLRSKFKYGYKDYVLGNSVIWEVGRSLYQMTRRPYVSAGLVLFMGYMYALISRPQSSVPADVRERTRSEQYMRIRGFFSSRLINT